MVAIQIGVSPSEVLGTKESVGEARVSQGLASCYKDSKVIWERLIQEWGCAG